MDESKTTGCIYLLSQLAVNVLNLDSTAYKTFVGFERQSVPFMFGNYEIESTVNRLSLSASAQDLLCTLDFHGIQSEMLMSDSVSGSGHMMLFLDL
jgi:hypothetical protein